MDAFVDRFVWVIAAAGEPVALFVLLFMIEVELLEAWQRAHNRFIPDAGNGVPQAVLPAPVAGVGSPALEAAVEAAPATPVLVDACPAPRGVHQVPVGAVNHPVSAPTAPPAPVGVRRVTPALAALAPTGPHCTRVAPHGI